MLPGGPRGGGGGLWDVPNHPNLRGGLTLSTYSEESGGKEYAGLLNVPNSSFVVIVKKN